MLIPLMTSPRLHLLVGIISRASLLWMTQPPARTSHFNPSSVLSPPIPRTADIDGCPIQYGARRRDCSILPALGSNGARSLAELGQGFDQGCVNREGAKSSLQHLCV